MKRLELNGFKSFAKPIVLEFPHAVSAVVGPNGSGKSNVADAIRWVLGEQSIKSLRGKRGEDMIFNGSSTTSRLSRASVNLIFDNSNKEFPLEFEEVSLGRRVYRDGANEYMLNGSTVRLKDIIELLANVGFGSSQHHIIGQGEADRILYASPKERREVIEDALGLKIFQIKRLESERKLERTEENMREVAGLQREIQPHLKFLKAQAEKFEISSKLRDELKELLLGFLSKKIATIEFNSQSLGKRKSEPLKKLKKIESEISLLRDRIEKIDKKSLSPEIDRGLENKLEKIRGSQMNALRELGRLEGLIAAGERTRKETKDEYVSKKEVEKLLSDIASGLLRMSRDETLESLKRGIVHLRKMISDFLLHISGEKNAVEEDDLETLKDNYAKLKQELENLRREGERLSGEYEAKIRAAKEEAEETRKEEKLVYQLELEAGKLKDELRSFELEEEKIKLSREEYERELDEASIYLGHIKIPKGEAFNSEEETIAQRRKIERIKFKLEEAGGIDPAVVKEFEDISKRDEFLSKEVADLTATAMQLKQVMKKLEEKLEHDFKAGVSKINAEFSEFFTTMFGGGKAALKIIKSEARQKTEEELLEEETGEEGVDIDVDLPRKKIRSLDMLSGGERALTSIALLFAMSAVNPPPFLVLDETDAALDEANSQRYAKMLENLSRTSQLIVITHNRTTMRTAGILYGVTMGSDGISKLLSIKFEEAGTLIK
ncbi:AAA family ATPase [Candidatus Giovannonibacteria bacterium]|nr:AAA family ATPase [Candidatus Giovannonibacteria bacterium]